MILAAADATSHDARSNAGLSLSVQDVSLQVMPGQLSALIGPNGAGKTTLFALMSGFLRPDRGQVFFDGQDITDQPPERNARLGLTRTFQIVQPFAAQTVRENIAVGAHLHLASRTQALAQAEAVAQQVGLAPQLDKLAGELTVAGRKRLELARAMATGPELLLLDEIAGGLTEGECQALVATIRTGQSSTSPPSRKACSTSAPEKPRCSARAKRAGATGAVGWMTVAKCVSS